MKITFTAAAALVFSLALASFDFASAINEIKPLKAVPFCKLDGFIAADGTQNKNKNAKVCSSLEIGQLPAVNKMVSALIIEPRYNQKIKVNKPFMVRTKVSNIETGFFSDPNFDYYEIPQTLNEMGVIKGHSHITIQRLNGNKTPDPTIFAFFKGLNERAQNGVLSVSVDLGLPTPGIYRICTMNSSNSHQPVVMPVAQRGAQDDCIRIKVVM